MKKRFDAIVLGGGVIGCNTAYNLARRGASVAVLEKASQVASGASGRSSACIRLHYSVGANATLAKHAVRYFHNFKQELQDSDADAGFVQTGHMLVGGDDKLGAAMRGTVQSLASQGYETEMLDRETAREIHPQLKLDGVEHVGWEPGSGFADPYMTTTSFQQAARRHGCEFFMGCGATGLLRDVVSGAVRGVQTSEGDIEAGVVVSAMNIWTPSTLGAWLDMELPMRLEKHHLIAMRKRTEGYEAPSASALRATKLLPNVKCLMQESQPYFRAYDGGRSLLVGNNHPHHQEILPSLHADEWDETVTIDQQIHCAEIAARRFEGYDNAEIVHSWSGVYDASDDWQPVLGSLPGIEGLTVAFGFSGHGFKLSPIVGEMLAADALGEAVRPDWADCDISPYNIRRFAEGAELRGIYHGAAS